MSRGLHILLGALASTTLLLLVSWWYGRRVSREFEPEPMREWHPKTYWWEGLL